MGHSGHPTVGSSGQLQVLPSGAVESPERILELLADEAVQGILAATADNYVTVATIATQCDLAIATAYRKVNDLHEQGLLVESVRVRPHGKNVNMYTFRAVDIHVSVSQSGTPEVTFSISRSESATGTGTAGEEKQSG